MYHAKPTPITTYPGIFQPGTMDRRAPAITTNTAMNRSFVALSIVDQVCRVRGSDACRPFRAWESALFLCSPISGSSAVDDWCELLNLSGIRYYRSPNWSIARGHSLGASPATTSNIGAIPMRRHRQHSAAARTRDHPSSHDLSFSGVRSTGRKARWSMPGSLL